MVTRYTLGKKKNGDTIPQNNQYFTPVLSFGKDLYIPNTVGIR